MFGQNNNQHDQNQHEQPAATAPEPTPDADLGDHATSPASFGLPTVTPTDPTAAPAADSSAPTVVSPAAAATQAVGPESPDELLTLKQQALQQLSPLVGHLEQSPEEKFRTTMMMIQATDDHTKIKEAYEAAQAITDEKVRAQALLDVVNEINYFTQQHKEQ